MPPPARFAKRPAAAVADDLPFPDYTGEDEESEDEQEAPVAGARVLFLEPTAKSVPKKAAAPKRGKQEAPVPRRRGKKNSAQRAAAPERSSSRAPKTPVAPERMADERTRAALGENVIDYLVEALTDRARGKDDDQGQEKRRRKNEVASPQDDRNERVPDRLCEAFAVTLPGDKGRLLLAAAQKNNLFLNSQDAAYLDAFEKAIFDHGADVLVLKNSLAWLFAERDNFADRMDTLSGEDAASCLHSFANWWLGHVPGNASKRRGALSAALRRELGGKARITEVLKLGASWTYGKDTGDALLLAFASQFISHIEQCVEENVQQRAVEQTAARLLAIGEPSASRIEQPLIPAWRYPAGEAGTCLIPAWKYPAARAVAKPVPSAKACAKRSQDEDAIVGLSPVDEEADMKKRQERQGRFSYHASASIVQPVAQSTGRLRRSC